MNQELGIGKMWHTPEDAVADFFQAALTIQDGAFRCLDYSDLCPERLCSILNYLSLDIPASDFRQMLDQFSWDAKSGTPKLFEQRPMAANTPRPDDLNALYAKLKQRALADWATPQISNH